MSERGSTADALTPPAVLFVTSLMVLAYDIYICNAHLPAEARGHRGAPEINEKYFHGLYGDLEGVVFARGESQHDV